MTHRFLKTTALTCLAAVMATPSFAADGPTLSIENFVGTLTVNGADGPISVRGEAADTLSQRGDTTRIDGGQTLNNTNCRSSNGKVSLSIGKRNWGWRSGGYKDLAEYPQLKVTVPEGTHLEIKNSIIFGDVTDLGSADINISSCSDLNLGDVTGDMNARISGSGDLMVGEIGGALDLSISGSGDFESADVGALITSISGSGDANIADVRNSDAITTIRLSGSGDLEIDTIDTDTDIRISGSGDGEIEQINGALVIVSGGSGALEIDRIDATRLSLTSGGSGDVDIDAGRAGETLITAGGSANLSLDITTETARVQAGGSSNTAIKDSTAAPNVVVSGSANVKIGGERFTRR